MADAPELPLYDELASAHRALDQKLRDLAQYAHLTDDQQLEEVALKKRKLALKDRMMALRTSGPAAAAHA
jgi:uncharacterized protein YdcH (DUF465 family)